jgi:hypothetical protein
MATPEDADARMTVGELRRVLAARGAPWTVDESLRDEAPIPTHPSGVSSNSFRVLRAAARAVGVRGLDFAALLRARPPTNAFLVQQAVALGFLDGDEARRYGEGVPPEGPLSPDEPSETEPPGPSSGA